MSRLRAAAAISLTLTVAACVAPEGSPWSQTAYRVRADVDASLDADAGWGAAVDAPAVVDADRPFRIRFEIAGDAGAPAQARFGLQMRRNGGPWTDLLPRDFPYPDEISTPRVSIVAPGVWSSGEATDDVLPGSELPFAAGSGVGLDSLTAPWPSRGDAAGVHGEWEWPLVIRRFADGAVTNDEGDVFEFRMVDEVGRPAEADVPALVTLRVPPGLLGGTFVETPGRLGPWQTEDGDLHFPMEPAETFNVLMMVKSDDGGRSWREVDGRNRPATVDLEGFATARHGSRIHMLHQADSVFYHAFETREGAEGWVVRDEFVSFPSDPPTQVAALEARSDGSLVAVYGDAEALRLRIRDPGGAWGEERIVDAPTGVHLSGPQTAVTDDDVVHLAYTGGDEAGRSVFHRTLAPDGTLSPARRLAEGVGTTEEEAGALAPLVRLPEAGVVVVLYRLIDGSLWARRVADGGGEPSPAERVTDRAVVQNAVDSDQAGVDAIAFEGAVHVLFIDEATRDLYHVVSPGPGEWTPAAPVMEGIDAQWVRGALVATPAGDPVYGYVVDAGSDGGSGMNRFATVALGGGGTP